MMGLSSRVLCGIAVLLLVGGCKQVDLVAPTGSTLTLSAQPIGVDYGGSSTLTVSGVRPGGAPLPDGTVIHFTVNDNLGTITPNPGETRNGFLTATFRAGSRSGAATVQAVSGGVNSGGTGTDTTGSTSTTITIGDARATQVLVSASPQNLPLGGGTSQIRAIVTDADGNQLRGIGVIFTTDFGTLKSGGKVIRTNENGAAFDTLTLTGTNAATVTATTLNGKTGTATVSVPGTESCSFTFSPTDPVAGQTVTFTDTSSDQSNISSYRWDFGDGSTGNGRTTTHAYQFDGTYTIVHTIINNLGQSFVCDTQTITVSSGTGTGPQCEFSFSPTNPVRNEPITFDASASTDPTGNINRYIWDFGDGTGTVTRTTPTTLHSYPIPGTFSVNLTVAYSNGNSNSCAAQEVQVP